MAPIILGNSPESGVGNNIILANTLNLGSVSNIIVPYKDQYRVLAGAGGIAIGNTGDNRIFSTGTVILAGTNVTIGTSALGAQQYLNLSIADPEAAANYVSAGNYVSLSTSGHGTTISIIGLQSSGNYLTTAALSNHNHGSIAFTTGNIGGTIGTYTSGTNTYISGTTILSTTYTYNGWSLSIPEFLTTAALSDHSHTQYVGTGVTTGTTLGTDVKATLGTNGLSFRSPRFLTTAALLYHTHGNVSTVSTTGSLMSYASASSGLTLSIPKWITATSGINNIALSGNTSGTVTEINNGTVTIAGGNNITLSQDGNAFTIIGAASGSNAGIVFSMNESNTTGTKELISTGTLYLEGGNNVTVSQNSNSIQIIAGVGGGAALQGSGTYTQNSGTIQFANSNNFTFGLTDNQMTASFSQSTHNHPYLNIAESTYYQTNNLSSVFLTTAALSNHIHSQYVNTSITSQWLTTALEPNYTSHSHTQYLNTSISSAFQLTFNNSLSLGTNYTSHSHTQYVNSNEIGSLYFVNSSGNVTWSSSVTSNSTYLYGSAPNDGGLGTTYTTHTHGAFSGYNISGTSASNGLTLSVNTAAGGGIALRGSGTYIQNTGTVQFVNSNGLTFGLSNNGIMTGSIANNAGSLYFADSNGVTFGINSNTNSQSTVTASVDIGGVGSVYSGNFISLSTNSNSTTVSVINTSGFTYGHNSLLDTSYTSHVHSQYLTTAAVSNHSHAFSASGGSSLFQTLNFANSNGITFSNTNGSIMANHALQYTSATSAITASAMNTSERGRYFYTSNNTFANSTHTHGNISLALTNISGTTASASNGMTLSLSANTAAGGGIVAIGNTSASFTSGSVMLSGVNLTVNTSSTGASQYLQISAPAIGYLYFSNTNGHSWGSSVNGISTSIYIMT